MIWYVLVLWYYLNCITEFDLIFNCYWFSWIVSIILQSWRVWWILLTYRGIDYALANNEIPEKAQELAVLLKQVISIVLMHIIFIMFVFWKLYTNIYLSFFLQICHRKTDLFLQSSIMVLMVSVKVNSSNYGHLYTCCYQWHCEFGGEYFVCIIKLLLHRFLTLISLQFLKFCSYPLYVEFSS